MVLVIFTGRTDKINRIIHAKKLYNILSNIEPTEIIFSTTSEKLKKSEDVPPNTFFLPINRMCGNPITRAINETMAIRQNFNKTISRHDKVIIAGNNPFLSLYLRLMGKRTYYFAGGLNYKNKPVLPKIITFIKESLMGLAVNRIIVEDKFMKEYYSSFFKLFDNKTFYSGRLYVDEIFKETIPYDKRPKNLIFVGALEKEKGILDAIEIVKKAPEWNLLIIGNGPMKDEIKKIAKHRRNIRYLGEISHNKIPKYLNNSRFLLLLSKYGEGVPNIVLESLACKTPTISNKLTLKLMLHQKIYLANNINDVINIIYSTKPSIKSEKFSLSDAIKRYTRILNF